MVSKLSRRFGQFGIVLAICVTALTLGAAPVAASDCQKQAEASDELTNDCQAGDADQYATGDDPVSDTGKDVVQDAGDDVETSTDGVDSFVDDSAELLEDFLGEHGDRMTVVDQMGVGEPDHMSRADNMLTDD